MKRSKKGLVIAIVIFLIVVIGVGLGVTIDKANKSNDELENKLNTDMTVADLIKHEDDKKQIYRLPDILDEDIEAVGELIQDEDENGLITVSNAYINHSNYSMLSLAWELNDIEKDLPQTRIEVGGAEPSQRSDSVIAKIHKGQPTDIVEYVYKKDDKKFLARFRPDQGDYQLFEIED